METQVEKRMGNHVDTRLVHGLIGILILGPKG